MFGGSSIHLHCFSFSSQLSLQVSLNENCGHTVVWANQVFNSPRSSLLTPQALEAEKPSGIHVFAVLLHAHLAGRGIRLRHFRKGEEMKLLAYDDNFDFNFQEFQYLKEERTILPV